MHKIRITKKFTFQMAHTLWNYTGNCENIHGHTYELYVTVEGIPLQKTADPSDGMIIDFKNLKNLIQHNVIDEFDHNFIVNKDSSVAVYFDKSNISDINIKKVPFQPTCENLIIHFSEIIKNILPSDLKLYGLKLCESENSFVELFCD